jgi:hypothetical protein
MDLDGGEIHNEGRLKGLALKSRLFWDLSECHLGPTKVLFLSSSKILTPHPPLRLGVCPPPATKAGGTHSPGGEGDGGSIFWKTREIGFPSYSKICTLWCDLFSEQTEADYLRNLTNFSARNILHNMGDPQDEMSMDVSGSTSVEEVDPTGMNEDSRQSSSTAEMMPPEILTKIFEYLSIPDRLHFRFVPFKGPQFYTF